MNKGISYIIRFLVAKLFTFVFFSTALALIFLLGKTIVVGILAGEDVMQIFLSGINTGIIALAVFELALVVNKEYSGQEENKDVVASLRRTIPRFIGAV